MILSKGEWDGLKQSLIVMHNRTRTLADNINTLYSVVLEMEKRDKAASVKVAVEEPDTIKLLEDKQSRDAMFAAIEQVRNWGKL